MFSILARALRRAALASAAMAVLAVPTLAHEFKAGDVLVIHPWVRLPPANAPVAGGYVLLENGGATADRLLSANVAIAGKVEIHEMKVDDAGKMTMRQLASGLELPAGEKVELKPGGYHLMLLDLKRTPELGEMLEGSLTFEKGGTVQVGFKVEPPGGPSSDHGAEGHDHATEGHAAQGHDTGAPKPE